MLLNTAIHLIEKGVGKSRTPQVWADLGAGQGLFSHALSKLLPAGSIIHAIDKDGAALEKIKFRSKGVTVKTSQLDFTGDIFPIGKLHGVLMANSLHFVADKLPFLIRLKGNLRTSGRILLIEYDLKKACPWVPYPLRFAAVGKLAVGAGFSSVQKLGAEQSVYNDAMMYSVMIY